MKKVISIVLLIGVVCTLFLPVSAENLDMITVVEVESYSDVPFGNMQVNTIYVFPSNTAPQSNITTYADGVYANMTTEAPSSGTPTFNANANTYYFAGSCGASESLYSADYITGNTIYTIFVENKRGSAQEVECYNYNDNCIASFEVAGNKTGYGVIEPNYQRWYFKFPGRCEVTGSVVGGDQS